ncbi:MULTISPECIES: DUF7504 family protein [Salinibaculum]|uniref:DUF7504 family protein n=1 Tax=Salinibaculum TaxID=2732368 RepID=UPI0030D1AFCF
MSQVDGTTYEFEGLPLEPVDAGTNLLVTGPPLGGTRRLVMQLLHCGPSEGLLLVTTETGGGDVIDAYERDATRYVDSRMAVVDCTEPGQDDEARNVHAVAAPSDLTGIGIAYSSLYERLYGLGIERVRTGLVSLAPLLMYAEEVQPLYRFLHTVTGRIRTADGLGVSALDPESQDERTFRTLTQPFDGRVELRERDGTHELRCRGLPDQPDGWQPLDL